MTSKVGIKILLLRFFALLLALSSNHARASCVETVMGKPQTRHGRDLFLRTLSAGVLAYPQINVGITLSLGGLLLSNPSVIEELESPITEAEIEHFFKLMQTSHASRNIRVVSSAEVAHFLSLVFTYKEVYPDIVNYLLNQQDFKPWTHKLESYGRDIITALRSEPLKAYSRLYRGTFPDRSIAPLTAQNQVIELVEQELITLHPELGITMPFFNNEGRLEILSKARVLIIVLAALAG